MPVGTLVSGMAKVEHLRDNAESARNFVPMSAEERQAMIARVQPSAATGEMEYYKLDR